MSDPSDGQNSGDDDIVDVDAQTDGGAAGEVRMGDQRVPVQLSADIVDAVDDRDDVDMDDIIDAATPTADVQLAAQGQANAGEGATIPVQDVHKWNLSNASDTGGPRFQTIADKQIRKLEKNSVTYNEKVGDWILARDDLVPGVKERMKALIVGEDGLSVDASDPDNDTDQRLEDHLREIYDGDVRPSKVIDQILNENLKNARIVLRSTDLQPLNLDTLTYVRDGITGDEIYFQQPTSVQTFDVEDDPDDGQDFDIESERIDGQPLVIGEQVFDASLYDTAPLEAVADTVVNKKVMQRLKARKAEITSFGALYAKVNPPEYLPEDEYFDYVEGPDGEQVTKLERALNQNLDNAFETLQEFQSGTVMAVPMHWDLEQLQIPEGTEPLDDQIRGYNQDIARRLLIPLDLIELESGSELSRDTIFRTLMATIRGWRQEIIRVFDQFADVQKAIHGVDGSVSHSFPDLDDVDPETVTQLLNFAGPAGMTEKEVRQLMNRAGTDLTIDEDTDSLPQAGGPGGPQTRQDTMTDFLEDQGQQDTPDAPDAAGDTLAAQDTPFEADIFRVVLPDDHDGDGFDDDVVGIGIDFPNSDVYVDWRNSVFPDELEESHVSIYGSIDDLERATGNVIEPLDTIGVEAAKALAGDAAAHLEANTSWAAQKPDWGDAQSGGPDWSPPTLQDFDGDLDAAADAHLYAENGFPPDTFGELGYAVVTADGTLRLDALDSAWKMAGQVDGPEEAAMALRGTIRDVVSDVWPDSDLMDRIDTWFDENNAEGASTTLAASHAFSGFESLREAAAYIRDVISEQLSRGHTAEVTHRNGDRAVIVVHDRNGDFEGSVTVKQSSTDTDDWRIVGTDRFFDTLDRSSDIRRVGDR